MKYIKTAFALFAAVLLASCTAEKQGNSIPPTVTMSKAELLDKIKGGWAGQTIGCTYGGPTEFEFKGTMIQDYVPIEWEDGCIKWYYDNFPGLYDDVYMDLTFVNVFDRLGLDAPADSLAMAFATAGYNLWAANQCARYNILNGIMPPESGYWKNNPHADDIDYQIEADYSGLMSPGMPNTASEFSEKVGHIMNCGDGFYGGVYVGAMYSLAFVSDDVEFIVREALKTIPEQSHYRKCISDVIAWYGQYPDDWKQTWFEVQKKYSEVQHSPDGVFVAYDIDATINSAYVVIGLLYGKGDFGRTIDIATRCGQDSDCNPATAGGILGTVLGYSNIPEQWMDNLREVEDIDFAYTDISLNRAYTMSFNQALEVIGREGGEVSADSVTIRTQKPVAVPLEVAFEGLVPSRRINHRWTSIRNLDTIEFTGSGIVVGGGVRGSDDYVAEVEARIDGELVETFRMPVAEQARRYQVFWNYDLLQGDHTLTFKWLNPSDDADIYLSKSVVFSK